MRASVLDRARNGGLLNGEGGISDDRKKKWLTARLTRADAITMREMYKAGFKIGRIGRIFGLKWQRAADICHGRAYPNL